ncbi:MAG: hypothetical protein ABIJ42_07760 [Acidobacteriota bacterium]
MRDALEAKPVSVFNLASEDLNLIGGLDMGSVEGTAVISTNLISPVGTGFEHVKRYSVKEAVLSNGWPIRIGFLGIADPRMVKPNSGFSAKDPLSAIAEVLPEIKDNVDLVVVIGEMTEETADKIAGKFPEVYAVLRSERSFRMTKPRQVSNALIMSSVERGRMLGQLTLSLDSEKKVASYTYKYVDLNQRVKSDPALAARAGELSK